jgi:hypothetical protein
LQIFATFAVLKEDKTIVLIKLDNFFVVRTFPKGKLSLYGNPLSEGVNDLQAALPNCRIVIDEEEMW